MNSFTSQTQFLSSSKHTVKSFVFTVVNYKLSENSGNKSSMRNYDYCFGRTISTKIFEAQINIKQGSLSGFVQLQ
jgi:hypothetical protein